MLHKKSKLLLKVYPLVLGLLLAGCGNSNSKTTELNGKLESSMSDNSESTSELQKSEFSEEQFYQEVIDKYRNFINDTIAGQTDDWLDKPWVNLISPFYYMIENNKDIKSEACYALKDLNGDGKRELILLLKDYTIQAIYTLSEDNEPVLVDSYWERNRGYLYKDSDSNDGQINICSYGSSGAAYGTLEIATLNEKPNITSIKANDDELEEENPMLTVRKIYSYNGDKTGKVSSGDSVIETHCFCSSIENGIENSTPITDKEYMDALDKFAKEEQTKKVGLELKPIFET